MSGFFIFIAVLIGVVAAIAFWLYGERTGRSAGRVRPDAPPSEEEQRRAGPSDDA